MRRWIVRIYSPRPAVVLSLFAVAISLLITPLKAIAGTLYVADYDSGNIYAFTDSGSRSTFASLSDPQGLAIDSSGNLFVADYIDGNIYKFTPTGSRTTFATGLSSPIGLAFDAAGNLFAGSYAAGEIYRFTPSGSQSIFASSLPQPYGMTFDANGNLFVAVNDFTTGGRLQIHAPGQPIDFRLRIGRA